MFFNFFQLISGADTSDLTLLNTKKLVQAQIVSELPYPTTNSPIFSAGAQFVCEYFQEVNQ